MDIQPLEDKVLLESLEAEKTASWFYIAKEDKKPTKGKVIAVWPGMPYDNWSRSPMDVKPGDIVYFTRYQPDEIEVTEDWKTKSLRIIRHAALLAVER